MISITESILDSIQASNDLYYKLLLITGEKTTEKSGILESIAKSFNVQVINLSLSLSAQLLELTIKQRVLRLPDILQNVIDPKHPLEILDHIEILFDPQLQQDPLQLLKRISRNQKILVSWNGPIKNKQLVYAEPNHPEYRSYKLSHDFLYVDIDGSLSINLDGTISNQED